MADQFPIPAAKKMRLSPEYTAAPPENEDDIAVSDTLYGHESPMKENTQPITSAVEAASVSLDQPVMKPLFFLPGLGCQGDSTRDTLMEAAERSASPSIIIDYARNGTPNANIHGENQEPTQSPRSGVGIDKKIPSDGTEDTPDRDDQNLLHCSLHGASQRLDALHSEGVPSQTSDSPTAPRNEQTQSLGTHSIASFTEGVAHEEAAHSLERSASSQMDGSMNTDGNGNLNNVPSDLEVKMQIVDEPHPIECPMTSRAEIELPTSNVTLEGTNGEAEVEYDSSPYESSSDESSDSSSEDDSDDSDEEDYELLDPAEQARRLMEDDGGSDGEGQGKANANGQVRTLNEKPDEAVDIPDIKITPDTPIEELGNVQSTIENLALIRAKVTGEYQVLNTGSLLCLEDRTVIGVVAETLGKVQEPLYCVRFSNADSMENAKVFPGTLMFYVPQHSNFVFTKSLQSVKGSDASNIHDEEVAEDEMEFSDDEAEAEHRRMKKFQRQEKKLGRNGAGRDRTLSIANQQRHRSRPHETDVTTLKYEDSNAGDELYTPLARPSVLNEVRPPSFTSTNRPPEGFSRAPRGMRGRGNRGQNAGRGRGDRRFGGMNGRPQPAHSTPDLSLPPTPKFPGSPNQQPPYDTGLHSTVNSPPALHYQTPTPGGGYSYYNGDQGQISGGFNHPQNSQHPRQSNYQSWQQNYGPPSNQQPYQPPEYQQAQATQDSTAPLNPALPPGAFINPAFFANNFQTRPG